jgi:hypothetical protein
MIARKDRSCPITRECKPASISGHPLHSGLLDWVSPVYVSIPSYAWVRGNRYSGRRGYGTHFCFFRRSMRNIRKMACTENTHTAEETSRPVDR